MTPPVNAPYRKCPSNADQIQIKCESNMRYQIPIKWGFDLHLNVRAGLVCTEGSSGGRGRGPDAWLVCGPGCVKCDGCYILHHDVELHMEFQHPIKQLRRTCTIDSIYQAHMHVSMQNTHAAIKSSCDMCLCGQNSPTSDHVFSPLRFHALPKTTGSNVPFAHAPHGVHHPLLCT